MPFGGARSWRHFRHSSAASGIRRLDRRTKRRFKRRLFIADALRLRAVGPEPLALSVMPWSAFSSRSGSCRRGCWSRCPSSSCSSIIGPCNVSSRENSRPFRGCSYEKIPLLVLAAGSCFATNLSPEKFQPRCKCPCRHGSKTPSSPTASTSNVALAGGLALPYFNPPGGFPFRQILSARVVDRDFRRRVSASEDAALANRRLVLVSGDDGAGDRARANFLLRPRRSLHLPAADRPLPVRDWGVPHSPSLALFANPRWSLALLVIARLATRAQAMTRNGTIAKRSGARLAQPGKLRR